MFIVGLVQYFRTRSNLWLATAEHTLSKLTHLRKFLTVTYSSTFTPLIPPWQSIGARYFQGYSILEEHSRITTSC